MNNAAEYAETVQRIGGLIQQLTIEYDHLARLSENITKPKPMPEADLFFDVLLMTEMATALKCLRAIEDDDNKIKAHVECFVPLYDRMQFALNILKTEGVMANTAIPEGWKNQCRKLFFGLFDDAKRKYEQETDPTKLHNRANNLIEAANVFLLFIFGKAAFPDSLRAQIKIERLNDFNTIREFTDAPKLMKPCRCTKSATVSRDMVSAEDANNLIEKMLHLLKE